MPAGAFLRDLGLHRLKDFGQAEQLFQLEADGLQVAFPPLRSLEDPTVLASLPAFLSSCIGRDAELVELEGLITGSRLVTLTGPGGVGKTRLAIEVAKRVAGEFADGVAFVDLAPLRDAGLVLGAIARRLGVDERDATPLADLLAVSLRGRRLLVLLFLLGWAADNAGPGASEQAEAFGTEALGQFRAVGDTGWQAEVLFMLGTFGVTTGDHRRAARLFADSLTLQRKRVDEKSTTRGLGGLAGALLNIGEPNSCQGSGQGSPGRGPQV
jgi:hypothetical protein